MPDKRRLDLSNGSDSVSPFCGGRSRWRSAAISYTRMRYLNPVCGVAAVVMAAMPLQAQPPQKIDVSDLPAQMVSDVVVPVPSEVFNVLDRMASPNWHAVLRSREIKTPAERPEIALLMGAVIAEGFIAVEAQNAEAVQDLGIQVLRLAAALGVREHVVRRTDSIRSAADSRDWTTVKREFDGALSDVRGAMSDLNDEELAQLVSLGGWLRGTEAVTQVVRASYTTDQAELLHQPVLLDYFEQRLGNMRSRVKSNPVVSAIQKRLPELRPLIKMEDGSISKTSVDRIHSITAELVQAVTPSNS